MGRDAWNQGDLGGTGKPSAMERHPEPTRVTRADLAKTPSNGGYAA